MGALLKLVGLQTLFPFTFSRFSSGFSDFRSWLSVTDSSPTVHRATAFLRCSSVRSGLAVLAFHRDRFGAESAVAGSVSAGVTVGVADGNNSGEEDGLREGREKVLRRFFWGKSLFGLRSC